MTSVTMDRFGRILIPKKVRDRLGLTAGQELALDIENGKLMLEPPQEPVIVREGKALVFTGKLLEHDVDWVAWARENRMRQILESHLD